MSTPLPAKINPDRGLAFPLQRPGPERWRRFGRGWWIGERGCFNRRCSQRLVRRDRHIRRDAERRIGGRWFGRNQRRPKWAGIAWRTQQHSQRSQRRRECCRGPDYSRHQHIGYGERHGISAGSGVLGRSYDRNGQRGWRERRPYRWNDNSSRTHNAKRRSHPK